MRKNVGIGRNLGHIQVPDGMLVGPREVEDLPDEKVVIVSTGSQGEPLSALRRMAWRDHHQVQLHEGDTVVFSATPVPGNERAVNETIDRLYHIGCEVITPREAPVHASGHGYAEEVKLMLNLVRPRYVMPFHGDFKRIRLHAELAEAVGVPPENIFRGENGLPLDIDAKGARFGAHETVRDALRRRCRDRRDGRRGAARPADALRGRHLHRRRDDLRAGRHCCRRAGGDPARRAVRGPGPDATRRDRRPVDETLADAAREKITEVDLLQQSLHDALAKLVYDRLRRRPMVLPVVIEI